MSINNSTKISYNNKNAFIKTSSIDTLLNFYQKHNLPSIKKKLIQNNMKKLINDKEQMTLWVVYIYEYYDNVIEPSYLVVSDKLETDDVQKIEAREIIGYFDELNKLFLVPNCKCEKIMITICSKCNIFAKVINSGNFTLNH